MMAAYSRQSDRDQMLIEANPSYYIFFICQQVKVSSWLCVKSSSIVWFVRWTGW